MSDDIKFPPFFMRSMLNNAGWPREQGKLRNNLRGNYI